MQGYYIMKTLRVVSGPIYPLQLPFWQNAYNNKSWLFLSKIINMFLYVAYTLGIYSIV